MLLTRWMPRSTALRKAIVITVTMAACSDQPAPFAPDAEVPPPAALIVPRAENPTQVSTGNLHTCVVQTDSTIACWGRNFLGQATPPGGTFGQVSAGVDHTCAVKTNGTLACWGLNDDGQATPPAGIFTQVSAGWLHTCGVRADDTVECWGYDVYGQSSPPDGTFTQVSAGDNFSCGVRTNGALACWSSRISGFQTPDGEFTQVTAGGTYACGLRVDGTILCWGRSTDGRTTPPAGTFARLGTGYALKHNCAIRIDGTLACWGLNDYGEATPASGTFTHVAAGGHHTCAIDTGGALVCWGRNQDGQITTAHHVPPAATFAAPSSVAFGETFSLTLTEAHVPDHPEATDFTFAFDCGEGTGYAPATATSSTTCVASSGGELTVHGKVIDHDDDSAEYSAIVTVTAIEQAITFTSQPPSPAIIRGSYAPAATGGDSGNPVVFSSLTPDICTVTGTNATFVDVGTCTLAADQDGGDGYTPAPQVTQSFDIRYGFIGFFRPVKNPPAMNVAKAGQTVVLRWMVVDARGWPVTNLTDVTVSVSVLECGSGGHAGRGESHFSRTATGEAGNVRSGGRPDRHWAGRSGLKHLAFGFYQFNWKTSKSYAKSCQTMQLDLGDGTAHQAVFRFK